MITSYKSGKKFHFFQIVEQHAGIEQFLDRGEVIRLKLPCLKLTISSANDGGHKNYGAIAAFLKQNFSSPEEFMAHPEIMRKREFFPFENDLTDNRLDALKRVRPDIVQSRPPDQLPERKVWRGFIKKLICPGFIDPN